MDKPKSREIARKNDFIRRTFAGGMILLTSGVEALEAGDKEAVLRKVRKFNDFNEGNDPYGEHDFGTVTHNGMKYFFKFDYYDENLEYHQEDGNRVLTIMRADEY